MKATSSPPSPNTVASPSSPQPLAASSKISVSKVIWHFQLLSCTKKAWANTPLGSVTSSSCLIATLTYPCFGLWMKSTTSCSAQSFIRQTVKEDKSLVYEDWKSCIVPFVESAPVKLDPSDFGVEHYFAAKSLISSRSFQIDEYYGFGMVPFADLFNHKTNAEDVHFTNVSSNSESDDDTDENMESQVDNDPDGDLLRKNESNVASPEGSFSADDSCPPTTEILEMILVRDVKAGAEVFNTYGTMGNAALLHRYGFTEPDNPYDIVNIDLELVLQWSSSLFSSRYTRSHLSLWRRLHHPEFPSQHTEYFEISYDGEPEIELLKLIFIILLPEKAYNEFNLGVSTAQKFDKSIPATISKKERIVLGEVTESNKKLLLTEGVRGALLSLADIREKCYGSRSMEDDLEALKTCPVTEKKLYHSLVLRTSERTILEKLRSYASARNNLRKR